MSGAGLGTGASQRSRCGRIALRQRTGTSAIAQATGSGEAGNTAQVLDVYSRIGWFSIVVGGLVLLVSPYVKRMMHLDQIANREKEA